MAGAQAAEMADHRRAGQVEVAERVEQLVADEFVGVAQPPFVEDGVAADDDGVVERAAARQPGRPHLIDLVQEPEGAGTADLGLEGLAVEDDAEILLVHRPAGEIDLEAHREPGIRHQAGGFVAVADRDGLEDADGAPRRVLLGDAGAFDEEDERRGAAVHDRHFGTVELHHDIVDLGAGERRHEMLDRADGQPFAVAQGRAQQGFDGVPPARGDLGAAADDIHATEDDAAIRRRRKQRHGCLYPGMETDAATMDWILDRVLLHDVHSLAFVSPPAGLTGPASDGEGIEPPGGWNKSLFVKVYYNRPAQKSYIFQPIR